LHRNIQLINDFTKITPVSLVCRFHGVIFTQESPQIDGSLGPEQVQDSKCMLAICNDELFQKIIRYLLCIQLTALVRNYRTTFHEGKFKIATNCVCLTVKRE
jgi:hypothetical protein